MLETQQSHRLVFRRILITIGEPMNNKMPLSSIFDGKDHETFVSINLALQALQTKDVPQNLLDIAEQALIDLMKVTFDPDNLN